MDDYNTYLMVKSATETAKKLGLELQWRSGGWRIGGVCLVRGKTVTELHNYLNGYSDGRLSCELEKQND